jgi:hypothetical protein
MNVIHIGGELEQSAILTDVSEFLRRARVQEWTPRSPTRLTPNPVTQ